MHETGHLENLPNAPVIDRLVPGAPNDPLAGYLQCRPQRQALYRLDELDVSRVAFCKSSEAALLSPSSARGVLYHFTKAEHVLNEVIVEERCDILTDIYHVAIFLCR